MIRERTKVSVIMPAFNAGEFIAGSIRSVLGQDIDDWELIIVDDGSTDATTEICKGFDDSRIRLLRQSHSGVSAARNRGIAAATGEWIAFLDADDLFFPDTLSRFVRTVSFDSENRLMLAYGEVQVHDETTGVLQPFTPPVWAKRPQGEALVHFLRANPVCVNCAIVRKTAIDRVGGFRHDLRWAEDWEFFARVSSQGVTRYIAAPPLAVYRQHVASSVRSGRLEASDLIAAVDAAFDFAARHGRIGAKRLQHLRRARESSAFSYLGTEALKSGRWSDARRCLRKALRRRPFSPREWILFSCALTGTLPAAIRRRLR